MQGGRATQRQLERKTTFFWDAFAPADQPVGLQPDLKLARQRRRFEVGTHRQRHRQQHRVLIAVVGQVANGDLVWQWPGDVACRQTCGQRPLQRGGQAGVT